MILWLYLHHFEILEEKRDNNNAQNQDFQISDQIFNANFNQRPIEDHNSVTSKELLYIIDKLFNLINSIYFY